MKGGERLYSQRKMDGNSTRKKAKLVTKGGRERGQHKKKKKEEGLRKKRKTACARAERVSPGENASI